MAQEAKTHSGKSAGSPRGRSRCPHNATSPDTGVRPAAGVKDGRLLGRRAGPRAKPPRSLLETGIAQQHSGSSAGNWAVISSCLQSEALQAPGRTTCLRSLPQLCQGNLGFFCWRRRPVPVSTSSPAPPAAGSVWDRVAEDRGDAEGAGTRSGRGWEVATNTRLGLSTQSMPAWDLASLMHFVLGTFSKVT